MSSATSNYNFMIAAAGLGTWYIVQQYKPCMLYDGDKLKYSYLTPVTLGLAAALLVHLIYTNGLESLKQSAGRIFPLSRGVPSTFSASSANAMAPNQFSLPPGQ